MSLPVFYSASAAGAAAGESVLLDGDEGRHAVVVKRIRVGEEIELTDGLGTRARVRVDSTTKKTLTGKVLESSFVEVLPPFVTVVQAIPKGDRGELAVELLTEIGADVIVPWAAARCVAVWRGERAARAHTKWVSASRTAAKQARRACWPTVADLATTTDVVALVEQADLAVVLHEEAEAAFADLPVEEAASLLVVVGPEGGLTADEVAAFGGAGAHAVRLGDPVLRTSTAGVVGVAALLSRTRRWGSAR